MMKSYSYGFCAVLAVLLSFQALAVGDSADEGQQPLPAGKTAKNPETQLPVAEEPGTQEASRSRAEWKKITPREEIKIGVSVPFPADI